MKKNTVSAIVIAMMISMTPAAFAGNNTTENGKNVDKNNTNSNQVEVSYVAEDDGYLVLLVQLKKEDNKMAILRITDGLGEELYSERIFDNKYSRYIKVSPEELKSLEFVYNTNSGITTKKYNLNVTKIATASINEVVIK